LSELSGAFAADAFCTARLRTDQAQTAPKSSDGALARTLVRTSLILLINLATRALAFSVQFNRAGWKSLWKTDPVRVPARERFRFYRERAILLQDRISLRYSRGS